MRTVVSCATELAPDSLDGEECVREMPKVGVA